MVLKGGGEYDQQGKEVHYKNSNGLETWNDNHPDNPKNRQDEEVEEKDIGAFEFKK